MSEYIIQGGRKIDGEVDIQGAKNAVLPMLAAAVLTDEEVIIENCPDISDVRCMLKILETLGAKVFFENKTVSVCCKGLTGYTVNLNLSKEMRSSVFLLGALCSRFKKAKISFPGGCKIGKRPIDLHISGLKELGIMSECSDEFVFSEADVISGNTVILKLPSVGATENIILASVFCKGETLLYNAAKEPEIINLVNLLNLMGANISGEGSSLIKICGVKKLHGAKISAIPDRIEACTYAVLPLICTGKIAIRCAEPNILFPVEKIIENSACNLYIKNGIIKIRSDFRPEFRKKLRLETGPYPEFPTDLQPEITVLFALSSGNFEIKENLFETRFAYVKELVKCGADIKVNGRTAFIRGVERFNGATLYAPDLRGGAALALAGAAANGTTVIKNVYYVERGYSDFIEKLKGVGVDIKRV